MADDGLVKPEDAYVPGESAYANWWLWMLDATEQVVKKAGPYPDQHTAITFAEENVTSDVEWMVTRAEHYVQLLPDLSVPVDEDYGLDDHELGQIDCGCDICAKHRDDMHEPGWNDCGCDACVKYQDGDL